MSWNYFTDYLDPSHKAITHGMLEELWNATNERAQAIGGELVPDAPGTIGKVVSCRYRNPNGSMHSDGVKPAPYWLNRAIAPNNYLRDDPEVPLISNSVTTWLSNDLFAESVDEQGYPPTSEDFLNLTTPTVMFLNIWRQMIMNCLITLRNQKSTRGFRTYDGSPFESTDWGAARDGMISNGFIYGPISGASTFQITGSFTGTSFGSLYHAHSTNIEFDFDIPDNQFLNTKGYSFGKGLAIQGDMEAVSPVDIFVNDSLSGTFTPPVGDDENSYQMIFDSDIVTDVGSDVKLRLQYRAASDAVYADLYRPPVAGTSTSRLHRLLLSRTNMFNGFWIRPNFSQS